MRIHRNVIHMRARYIHLLICFGLFISLNANGQTKLGQWRTHLPYKYCNLAEVTDDRVFCSATGGLFYFILIYKYVEKLTKINGL